MALGVDTHYWRHESDFKKPGACGRHAPGLKTKIKACPTPLYMQLVTTVNTMS